MRRGRNLYYIKKIHGINQKLLDEALVINNNLPENIQWWDERVILGHPPNLEYFMNPEYYIHMEDCFSLPNSYNIQPYEPRVHKDRKILKNAIDDNTIDYVEKDIHDLCLLKSRVIDNDYDSQFTCKLEFLAGRFPQYNKYFYFDSSERNFKMYLSKSAAEKFAAMKK